MKVYRVEEKKLNMSGKGKIFNKKNLRMFYNKGNVKIENINMDYKDNIKFSENVLSKMMNLEHKIIAKKSILEHNFLNVNYFKFIFWAFSIISATTAPAKPNPAGCYLAQSANGLIQVCPGTPPQPQPCTINCKTTTHSEITAPNKGVPAIIQAPVQPVQPVQVQNDPFKVVKKKESPLSTLEKIDPNLVNQLQRILAYNGIEQPWDRIKDFYDDKQRIMPSPCMLYKQMRDVLKVFESLKQLISDELRKIQIYVERAKMYLKEDHVKLNDQLQRMEAYLDKMRHTNDKNIKNEYAVSFENANKDTQQIIEMYNQLKDWLFKTLTCFKLLF